MELSRKSGILAHPTSFPSPYGIGDLGPGTYEFIDFLERSNQKLWQILPLNPTSFGDSPYQCFSTFAGNIYIISPDILKSEGLLSEDDLNNIPDFSDIKIDYGNVIQYKEKLLRTAYNNFCQQDGLNNDEFIDFCENTSWLDDYVLFVSLKYYFISKRKQEGQSLEYKEFQKKNKKLLTKTQIDDFYYGAVWNSWPKSIVKRSKTSIQDWSELLADEINFRKFSQYIFFKQWKNVKKYANDKNIEIIGDIPIFVAMDSADVWANQDLFYLDGDGNPTVVAGVPPDYFSDTGQLWGNPLYNWNEHKKESYSWWIRRINSILTLVDIIRIDHFRGFDEYWAVPYGEKTAMNGNWCEGPGKDLFLAIEHTLGKLPIIAEDLGIITESVEELRDSFNLPGMKILQFAFDADEENEYLPHNYRNSNCVAYTGTHDNDTTVGWYNTAPKEAKNHFREYMNVSGQNPSWELIRLVWSSVASFALCPVQDLFSQDSDSRMNIPGNPSGNWQYRFTSEQLTGEITDKLIVLGKLFDR